MLPAWPRSSPRTATKHQSRGGERVALGGAPPRVAHLGSDLSGSRTSLVRLIYGGLGLA